MNAEPRPGTELERRGDMLPDVAVANRAGSIVTEFVSSIVDEAEARGNQIIDEAHEEAEAERREAAAGATRIRDRTEAVIGELSALLGELRSVSAALAGEPEPEPGPESEPALPPRLTPARGHGAEDGEHIVEAIVVDDGEPGERGGELVVAERNGSAGAYADDTHDDPHVRVARMSDEELGRAYSNAIRAANGGEDETPYAEWLRALAEAAVEEALRRPAFADAEAPPPRGRGLRFRAGARRRRRRALLLRELREACRTAREQQLTAVTPGS